MNNYPPGVTGNEPQITGEWPCVSCDGEGGGRDEDGTWSCPHCKGSGIEPEEFDLEYVKEVADNFYSGRFVEGSVLDTMRYYRYDRNKPEDREMLRALIAIRHNMQEKGWL